MKPCPELYQVCRGAFAKICSEPAVSAAEPAADELSAAKDGGYRLKTHTIRLSSALRTRQVTIGM